MGRHTVVTDRIQLCVNGGSVFDLELRGNLVVVEGYSGQGKTYFFNSLRDVKYSEFPVNVQGVDLSKVEFINIFSKGQVDLKAFIQKSEGKLFIIDNADSLLTNELAAYIGWDIKNQYIVFARASWPFGVSPNYYAGMRIVGNKHVLQYAYSVKGWY